MKSRKQKAVLISCFAGWYENRLEPISKILEEHYEITTLVSDYDHLGKKRWEKRFGKCTFIHVPQYSKNLSVKRIYSHLFFGKKVAEYLNQINPDLIYVLLPPNNLSVFCLRYIKRHPACKYFIDIIDLWPESLPLKHLKYLAVARYWGRMRNESLDMADHIFTECEMYVKILKRYIDVSKTSTLYLFKRQTEADRLYIDSIHQEKSHKTISEDMSVAFAYIGSINHIIDMDGICSVLKRFVKKNYIVFFHIIGSGEGLDEFLVKVKNTGCKYKYYGAVYDEKKKADILKKSDFGFNMMIDTVSVGLTIKSLDYFSVGLPIINKIKGDSWKLVKQFSLGINYTDNINIKEIETFDLIQAKTNVEEFFLNNFTEEAYRKRFQKSIKGLI